MNKLCNIFKRLLLGILLLTSVSMLAQPEGYNRANLLLREKNADQAVLTIDSVIVHPETRNDPASWTLRAYIYFELYKQRSERLKLYSPVRDTIIRSIKRSYQLKADPDNASNNEKLIVNLSKGYFNLARTLLQDSINEERSSYAYNKYKELALIADSTSRFEAKDIEYYLAVGSVYSEMFVKDNKDVKSQNIAKVALLKVLDYQEDNASANITLGLMYYNQAVNLTREMDYGESFEKLDFIQESIIKLAKQSEQFIYKVYSKDNKNQKAIEALYYIYRMLNENAKSDEYKKIGEQYGIKFNVEEKADGSTPPEDKKEEQPKEQPKEEKAPEPKKEEPKVEKSKEELEKEEKAAAEKAKADEKAFKEAEKKAKKDKEEQEKREAKEKKEAEKKAKEEAKAKEGSTNESTPK